MLKTAGFTLLILAACAAAQAEDKGWYGFAITVEVSTFMNLESATIKELRKDSEAAKLGMVDGDRITSVDGCEIPGCGAFKARGLFSKPVGAKVHLKLKHADGTEYAADLTSMPVPAEMQKKSD